MTLWRKFQQVEDKYVNAELLLILAKFCDFVLSFEMEAENLYLKGSSLLSSLKLQ